jgi:hypothetical protein
MCDNPEKNPWEVLVDPAMVRLVLAGVRDRVRESGVEQLRSDFPALSTVSREDLVGFLKGIERDQATEQVKSARDLAHVEFDVHRLKELSEDQLRDLLQKKLVARIIEDVKTLELDRRFRTGAMLSSKEPSV